MTIIIVLGLWEEQATQVVREGEINLETKFLINIV